MRVESNALSDLGSRTTADGYGIQVPHHIENNGFTIRADVEGSPGPFRCSKTDAALGLQRQIGEFFKLRCILPGGVCRRRAFAKLRACATNITNKCKKPDDKQCKPEI